MTMDIIERLRKWAAFGYGTDASKAIREAADEIERLRSALRRLLDAMPADGLLTDEELPAVAECRAAITKDAS